MLKRNIFKVICLTLIATNANALELCGEKYQGEIMVAQAPDANAVYFNGNNLPLTNDGKFLIAFDRDADLSHNITVEGFISSTKYDFNIEKQKWDIQNIKGLPQKKVTPSEEDTKEIERERTDIRKAQFASIITPFWEKGFIQPVEGRISGNFGGQRIMNDVPRNPHMGTDIAAPEGTEIKAASDGIVSLAGDSNYFYSGNVVIIDHGYGLFTIYAHMKDVSVKDKQVVKQGDIIGTVGKTGRATGAHLHWGASLNKVRFDPMSLLKINNKDFCFNL